MNSVILNLTTARVYCDTSCITLPGEHRFVKHKTWIAWERAIVTTIARMQQGIFNGDIEHYHTPIPKALMLRIWEGADIARNELPPRCRLILQSQDLIAA